uniref:Uncharacterized protein n=1 Tax=viral metagenome TaxID=1070528 RepID=A0A6M3LTQ8_9ZZZZ
MDEQCIIEIHDDVLIKAFGTQIISNLEMIKNRIAMVVVAMQWHGNQGDNPFCELNRVFEKIERRYEKK